jgi:Tol biopolymer transport system component
MLNRKVADTRGRFTVRRIFPALPALTVVLAITTAASGSVHGLITGRDINDHSPTAVDLKGHTLGSQNLSDALLRSLRHTTDAEHAAAADFSVNADIATKANNATNATNAGRIGQAKTGEIVFVSDRGSADQGEIWVLARGSAPKDLSNSHYTDVAAAVSPDGARVAFWSNRNGVWQVFVVGSDGHRLRPVLTARGASDRGDRPQFSRDGRSLLTGYASRSGGAVFAIVDLHRTTVRRFHPSCMFSVSWSPDGQRIACTADFATVVVLDVRGRKLFSIAGSAAFWSPLGQLAVVQRTRTAIVDRRGALVARLRGAAATESADGHVLALTAPGRLTLVDFASARTVRTITGPRTWTPYWIAFTPDAREVAYDAADENGRITFVRGGPIRRFPAGGTWSLGGRYAFFGTLSNRLGIKVGDRYGRGAQVVGRFWYDDHATARLIPAAGRHVVFESSGVRPHGELWTVQPGGFGLHQLTNAGNNIFGPAWNSDGSRLAYTSAKGPPTGNGGFGQAQIVIATPDGRTRSILPLGEDFDAYPSWSRDGSHLAVVHGWDGEIDVLQTNGGGRHVVARGSSPAWSPLAQTIAYCSQDGIHTVSQDGRNDRTVLPLSEAPSSVAWSPDGQLFAYTTERGLFVASTGGLGKRLVTARQTPSSSPSFSPDGAELAFTATIGKGQTAHKGVFVVHVDGTHLVAIVSGWYNAGEPTWRPVR